MSGKIKSPAWELFWEQYGQKILEENLNEDGRIDPEGAAVPPGAISEPKVSPSAAKESAKPKENPARPLPKTKPGHTAQPRRKEQETEHTPVKDFSFSAASAAISARSGESRAMTPESRPSDLSRLRAELIAEINAARRVRPLEIAGRVFLGLAAAAVFVFSVWYAAGYLNRELNALRAELDLARETAQIELAEAFTAEVQAQADLVQAVNSMAFSDLWEKFNALELQMREIIAVLENTDAAITASAQLSREEMAQKIEILNQQLAELERTLEILMEGR